MDWDTIILNTFLSIDDVIYKTYSFFQSQHESTVMDVRLSAQFKARFHYNVGAKSICEL